MNSTIEGAYDIGMASREAKDSELEAGLTVTAIAMDGIAVIVNNANAISGLSPRPDHGHLHRRHHHLGRPPLSQSQIPEPLQHYSSP